MKKETVAALAALLVIILGAQTYTIVRLNERLNQVSGLQIQRPDSAKPLLPKLNSNDDLFKDREWNPYEEMRRMQNQMERLFTDSFSRFHIKTPLGTLNSSAEVDLQEQPDRYIVTVNAPGADESSIDVKLEDRVLHISIKTEQAKDEADENGKYQYRERFVGQLQRVLTLPGSANAAKMETVYRNGVLTITIPKA